LGYAHPDYLIKYLTSRQIAEWMAYFQLEPFGPHAEELRLGIIGSIIANVFGGGKGSKKFIPTDFTVSLKPEIKQGPETGLADKLKKAFKNTIPASEWSRKKKKRKEPNGS
jgi:hypothetical protein